MAKIKLFTHSDLDGIGCLIIMKLAFPHYEIDCTICEPATIDAELTKFLERIIDTDNSDRYEQIYVTDLCYTKDIADYVDQYNNGKLRKNPTDIMQQFLCRSNMMPSVYVYDHHKTGLKFTNPEYHINGKCAVYSDPDKHIPTCGTMLVCENLIKPLEANSAIYQFAEIVRLYDTWDWSKDPDNSYSILAKKYNTIFKLYGKDRFVSEMLRLIRYYDGSKNLYNALWSFELEEDYNMIQTRNNDYINEKLESIIITTMEIGRNQYRVGYIMADNHASEIGNRACTNYEIDFCIIHSGNTFSLRSTKDDVDVSRIAKCYGGGGHFHAAGFKVNELFYDDIVRKFINSIPVMNDNCNVVPSLNIKPLGYEIIPGW